MPDDYSQSAEQEITGSSSPAPAPAPAPLPAALLSPYAFYFTGADALRLTVLSSAPGAAVAVHYRMARPDDPTHANAYQFFPSDDRVINVREIEVGEGHLLHATVFAPAGAPLDGQIFAKLQVIRGRGAAATVLGTVVQGYVSGVADRAWPGSPIIGSTEGAGFIRQVNVTIFPGIQEWTAQVPDGARWELLHLVNFFNTSAVVGNRRVELSINRSNGDNYIRSPAPLLTPASSAHQLEWHQGAAFVTAIETDHAMAFLPMGNRFLAGDFIASNTIGFQAGDFHGGVFMTVREWLEF